eukprot:4265535-Pleurochrysis_carterae.AAC.1
MHLRSPSQACAADAAATVGVRQGDCCAAAPAGRACALPPPRAQRRAAAARRRAAYGQRRARRYSRHASLVRHDGLPLSAREQRARPFRLHLAPRDRRVPRAIGRG